VLGLAWVGLVGTAATPAYGRTVRGSALVAHSSRLALRALGIRVHRLGRVREGASLVVGNHVSWLDLLVLAACAPQRPVAKLEVGDWPVIGGMARRCGAVFLDRRVGRGLPEAVDAMAAALRRGHRVQVFPEGTTRCGSSLQPFTRASFQAALNAAAVVSPVTLAYRDGAGRSTTVPAFVGDMTLVQSIRAVLAAPRMTVRVHWLPVVPAVPVTGHPATDRRILAARVEAAVARDLGQPVVRAERTPLVLPAPLVLPRPFAEPVLADAS
jgi:1-acyl-sn-glycerol-3-phosphate acyltransferase